MKPSRYASRSSEDLETAFTYLQPIRFGTLSFAHNNKVFSIPTGFGIFDNTLFFHGSIKSHFLMQAAKADSVCFSAFNMLGYVLCGSVLDHSVNYESVTAYGKLVEIPSIEERRKYLESYFDRFLPGRRGTIRDMSDDEIGITAVYRLDLEDIITKERKGDPQFSKADYERKAWTGVLPTYEAFGEPIPDPKMEEGVPFPEHLIKFSSNINI